MSNGFINAQQAKHNHFINSLVHEETSSIEKDILELSNEGILETIISDTTITNSDTNTPRVVTVDVNNSQFELTDHGFLDGDIVAFSTTDKLPDPLSLTTNYFVNVIDSNIFKVYTNISSDNVIIGDIGEGITSVKKLITSELYFQAWKYYYLYPNANTYITIINEVEEHFRKLGYNISKIEKSSTFNWKISWY